MSPTAIYNFLIGNSWQLMTSMLSSKIHISNNVIMVLTFSNLSRMDSHCWHWSVYVKKRHCGFCSPRPNLSGSSRALQQNTNCSSPLHPCLLGSHRLAPWSPPATWLCFIPQLKWTCLLNLTGYTYQKTRNLSTLAVPLNPNLRVVPRTATESLPLSITPLDPLNHPS